jgi:hypothetical protein
LRKHDSFRKLALMFADQVLLFSRSATLPWWLQPFAGSLQAEFHLCPKRLWLREPLCLHSLDCALLSGSCIWIQVSSIVTRWFKNPTGSRRNRPKMACEAALDHASDQQWDI